MQKGVAKKQLFVETQFLLLSEAIAAIDRTIAARFERNLARFAALCTDRIVHRAVSAAGGVAFTRVAAGPAALRLVCKALFGVEFLLAGSEGELLTAIFASQDLVVVHGIPLSFITNYTLTATQR